MDFLYYFFISLYHTYKQLSTVKSYYSQKITSFIVVDYLYRTASRLIVRGKIHLLKVAHPMF